MRVRAHRRTGLRLLAGAVLCTMLSSCAMLRQSTDDADDTAPASATGVQAWTGQGLVLASCGASSLSSTTIELWEIDPVTGEQTGHRPAVEVPGSALLAYSCNEPPALVRRLFNHDFTSVAVQIVDSDTGASRVGVLDLSSGQLQDHSRPPESAFSPLPDDGDALFDGDGRTLWYRSGNAADLGSTERSPDLQAADTLVSYDPEAPSEDAWTDHGAVATGVQELAGDDGDTNAWHYALAGGLADPSGQVVAIDDTLHATDDGRRLRMFCTAPASDQSVTDDDCIPSDSTTGDVPDIAAATWVDDDTLLAFDGSRIAASINTIVRLEFDGNFASVTATPALPTSDWLHRSVVVSLDCGQFATLAHRGNGLAIFAQDLYDGTETPATVTTVDTEGSEAPDAPSHRARLIDWVPGADEESTCGP